MLKKPDMNTVLSFFYKPNGKTGIYAKSQRPKKAEKLFEGEIPGPEEPSPTDPVLFYTTWKRWQIFEIADNGNWMKIVSPTSVMMPIKEPLLIRKV